ncbi:MULTISPECIES: fatty acid desaturase family protein [Corynebacterium]|uniref:fatty acid desaturase family protein n=1 Tax=Corynebacterium TaxID=1716 RepID=UPI0008A1B879|nr:MULTISPECIES: acyl-CoA desaturase [Corynebacterium]OFT86837.1 fatty acid desaturase [Corynebacterium sp. HMSC28B08]
MAIKDIAAYAHLSAEDVEEIGRRFDAIEAHHRETLGAKDAAYIRNLIRTQRGVDLLSRVATVFAPSLAGPTAATMGLAKILENLEIGHNVMHGQWDWMNDPEIHSGMWEWDNTGPASGWKHSHNFSHHTFTNIIGMDNDIGYGVIRITRDKKWKPTTALQPLTNVILAALFEYAVAFYDVELGRYFTGRQSWEETKPRLLETLRKVRAQVVKDYVAFPAVAGAVGFVLAGSMGRRNKKAKTRFQAGVGGAKHHAKRAAQAALGANLIRNVWAYAVIFCGHFPDDVETFTKRTLDEETKAEWYLRQMLGSANFRGGKVLTILSGNLNYQVEHHLFPDMPSNRLAPIAREVEQIAKEFGLPYNTASFPRQLWEVQRTILKLTLPNKFLRAPRWNAPEVRADEVFSHYPEVDASTGPRQLAAGLAKLKKLRPRVLA